jgi:hypothetical protein
MKANACPPAITRFPAGQVTLYMFAAGGIAVY